MQQVYDYESVTGSTTFNGQPAIVVTETIFNNPPSPSEVYRAFDGQGLLYLGNSDPADPLTPIVAPYREALLPAMTGLKWTTFRRSGAVYGNDLDGDGLPETAKVQGKATYGAFESVQTQLGQFENCLRLDTEIRVALRLSSIRRTAKVTAIESEWYAYGVGPVKSQTTVIIGAKPPQVSTMSEEVTGYRIDGFGRGILIDMIIATNLTTADSDTERPGQPAIASDGTNFFVVTSQDYVPPSGLIGVIVTGDGQVLQRFPITQQLSQFSHPNLIFERNNYLLTWQQNAQTYGAHISTNGTVLTGPFQISDGTGTQYGARAAFDGQRALVVWAKYTGQYDIVGAFVSADGTVSNEFSICTAPGEQVSPYVVFTGTNYFVAWRDTRSGSGPASDTDIYGTLVTPTGAVLDTNGVPLVATSDAEEPNGLAVDGQGRPLLVWSADGSVRAKRFTQDGTPLDGLPTAAGLLIAGNVGGACVAFDGVNYVFAYPVGSYSPPKGIYVSRMTPEGDLINAQPDGLGVLVRSPVELTERFLSPAFARGNGNLLLVWLNNRETMGELKAVEGALMYPF
jgi:hypothetical protein